MQNGIEPVQIEIVKPNSTQRTDRARRGREVAGNGTCHTRRDGPDAGGMRRLRDGDLRRR